MRLAEDPRADAPSVTFIALETEWRCPTALIAGIPLKTATLTSRWVDSDNSTTEASMRHGIDHHTISIALRPTALRLETNGKTSYDGWITFGMVQVGGPDVLVRSLFYKPCDFLHVRVTNALLAQCHAELCDEPWPGQLKCADTGFRRDTLLAQLVRILIAPGKDHVTSRYVDGIATAIAGRLTAIDSGPDASGRARVGVLAKWRLKRALDYVEAHLSEHVLLADIAAAAGLTRMHFAAQFRAAMGISSHEFLLQRRMEQAQALLRSSSAPIATVALSVGFSNQAHFSTVFRRLIGQSPRRWRIENAPMHVIVPKQKSAVLCGRRQPARP